MKSEKDNRPLMPDEVRAFREVINETRALFHRMKAVAEDLHALGDLSAGMRGVLSDLHTHGPQTVPTMARRRPVTRQHIQNIVNSLLEQDLVLLKDNPAHKRSSLIDLTEKGRQKLTAMYEREAQLLADIHLPLKEEDLKSSAAVLRQIRQVLEQVALTLLAGLSLTVLSTPGIAGI